MSILLLLFGGIVILGIVILRVLLFNSEKLSGRPNQQHSTYTPPYGNGGNSGDVGGMGGDSGSSSGGGGGSGGAS